MTMEMKLLMWDKTKGVNMNLDDLLKVNSVRCIKTKVHEDLVEGEIYKVEGFDDETIKIVDRNAFSSWHNKNLFEPVSNKNVSKSDSEIDIRENKLKELLKTGRARCTFNNDVLYLTKGQSYNVWGGYDNGNISVIDDSNMVVPYPLSYFEPINIASKTTENDTKVSFESSFKVGDKVYKYGEADVKTVLEVFEYGYMQISNYPHRVNHESICRATQENYEMLLKLYPHIKFELPPKPLTKSDLTKGMFERGDFAVVCKCSDTSEIMAIAMSPLRLIVGYSDGYFEENNGKFWKFAIPYDPKTRIPLTEDVLNETI